MSIRQYRPKKNYRHGTSLSQKILLNLSFLSILALQISYPLVHGTTLRWVTIATVIAGGLFAIIDSAINFGITFTYLLLACTLIFSFVVEAIGQKTQWPFGKYEYSSSLGISWLKVPLIVPLAWLFMSYLVVVASRIITHAWVFLVGGFGLMAWDLFLDPQMVGDGRWHWSFKGVSTPFDPNIPFSNSVGWLFSGILLMALLNRVLPKERRKKTRRTIHLDILLVWVFLSGVIGNLFFFHRTGVGLFGGLVFALFLVPFLYKTFLGVPDSN
jgi:putative membrane protein